MATSAVSSPAAPGRSKAPRVLSYITAVLGVLMLIIGVTMYCVVSSELSSQDITVAALDADNPGPHAGESVSGPTTAIAQIDAIAHHVDEATGGQSYAQLGNVATNDGKTYSKDVTTDKSTDGQAHKAGDPLSSADAQTYAARNTAMNGSFLEASLWVSVMGFGVSALIAGLGIVVMLIAATQIIVLRKPQAIAAKQSASTQS